MRWQLRAPGNRHLLINDMVSLLLEQSSASRCSRPCLGRGGLVLRCPRCVAPPRACGRQKDWSKRKVWEQPFNSSPAPRNISHVLNLTSSSPHQCLLYRRLPTSREA